MGMIKKNFYLILTLILASAVAILTHNIYEYHIWDSTAYLSNANYFLTGQGYFEIIRAPVLPLMLAGFVLFGLENFVPPIFIILFLISIYFLGKELFNKKVGFLAALLTAATPLFLVWAPRILTDVPAATFTVLAFIFANRAIKKPKSLYLFAFFSSLAFLTRYPAGIIFPIGLLYYLFRKKFNVFKEKETYTSIIPFVLPISFWFLWNFKNFGNPIYSIQQSLRVIIEASMPSSKLFYVLTFHETFGLLAIPAAIALFAGLKHLTKNKKAVLLYFWIVIGYIALSLMSHKESRYTMFLIPAVYLLTAGVVLQSKAKRFYLQILLILVLGSALTGYAVLLNAQSADMCSENIVEAAQYVSKTSGHVISSFWPIVSWHGKVIGEAFPASEDWLPNYIKEKNVTYIIVSDSGDAPDWAKDKEVFMRKTYLKFEREFPGPCQTMYVFKII